MIAKDSDQFKGRYSLAGTLERFEDKMAVIITDDGQKLLWPISNLPIECDKGAKVRIILSTVQTDQEEREGIAKTILNEILKNPEKKDEK